MDTEWTEYQCKSGQTLFVYNKVTGEHKWPTQNTIVTGLSDDNIMIGQPIIYKEFCSVTTQTDDFGCSNGCTSMYTNTGMFNNMDTQPQPYEFFDNDDDPVYVQDRNSVEGSSDFGVGYLFSISEVLDTLSDKILLANNHDTTETKSIASEIEENPTEHLEDNDVINGATHSDYNTAEGETRGSYCELILRDKLTSTTLILSRLQDSAHENSENNSTVEKCTPIMNRLKCPTCNKTFKFNSHFTVHLRTHTGEKPYECRYCDKKFARTPSLTNHLLTHTGEKPYKCQCCHKAFIQKVRLTEHFRTHTGERPYKCRCCNKTFTRKQHLTGHEKSHTREN